MTLADFFLRVGINAAAWLVAFVHLLFVLVIPRATCGSALATDPWTATTITGVVLAPLLLLMGVARSHRRHFRWLTVLPVMMAAWAVLVVLPYLLATTVDGALLCSVRMGEPSAGARVLARAWAPFQLLLIATVVWRTAQAWSDDG